MSDETKIETLTERIERAYCSSVITYVPYGSQATLVYGQNEFEDSRNLYGVIKYSGLDKDRTPIETFFKFLGYKTFFGKDISFLLNFAPVPSLTRPNRLPESKKTLIERLTREVEAWDSRGEIPPHF